MFSINSNEEISMSRWKSAINNGHCVQRSFQGFKVNETRSLVVSRRGNHWRFWARETITHKTWWPQTNRRDGDTEEMESTTLLCWLLTCGVKRQQTEQETWARSSCSCLLTLVLCAQAFEREAVWLLVPSHCGDLLPTSSLVDSNHQVSSWRMQR